MTGIDRPLPPRMALLLVMSILLSAVASFWGLGRLGDERHRLAAIEAMAEAGARPRVPLIAVDMAFSADDRRQALAQFEHQLGQAAAEHRLLVERLEALPAQRDQQALLVAEIAVSGSENDVKRFTSIIESGQPTIRFERWRVARTAAGESTVRIEARALALWDGGA